MNVVITHKDNLMRMLIIVFSCTDHDRFNTIMEPQSKRCFVDLHARGRSEEGAEAGRDHRVAQILYQIRHKSWTPGALVERQ